jgi:hypothetical protein
LIKSCIRRAEEEGDLVDESGVGEALDFAGAPVLVDWAVAAFLVAFFDLTALAFSVRTITVLPEKILNPAANRHPTTQYS